MTLQGTLGLGSAAGLVAGLLAVGYLVLAETVPVIRRAMEQARLRSDVLGPMGWAFWGVLVVLVVPVFEELIFRGVIFPALRDSIRLPAAVVASAALFAVVHPVLSWLPVFLLGVAAAWVHHRTRWLVGPIAAHGVYNALTVAANLSM